MLSDNSTEFLNHVIDLLSANLGILRVSTLTYSPWSNGLNERWNGVMKSALMRRVRLDMTDWPDQLPAVLLAYRVSVRETSKFSPFYILYGREPSLPFDTLLRPKLKYMGESWVTLQLGRMHHAFTLLKQNTQHERERQKQLYDRHTISSPLTVGMPV